MLRIIVQTLKIVTIATLAVIVGLGAQRFFDYYIDREKPSDTGRPFVLQVTEEDDGDSIAARLADAGMIQSELYFKTQLRLTGGDLQPQTYTLRKGMSVPLIVNAITSSGEEGGEVAAAEAAPVVKITVPEGWRTEQIAEEAEKQGLQGSGQAVIDAAAQVSNDEYEFLKDRPAGASLEGYLFPNTYDTASGSDLVYYMLDTFDAQFTPEMRQRAEEMNLSIHQVVTIASLVEREAVLDEERPIIAAVYLNRLEQGIQLDADPTVQYVVGKPGDWWPKLTEKDLYVESPYNTYGGPGLPPGPICNPSIKSIFAVLNPEPVDYIYFVAKEDGSDSHAFANNKAEHDANVCRYLGCDGQEPTDGAETDGSDTAALPTETRDIDVALVAGRGAKSGADPATETEPAHA